MRTSIVTALLLCLCACPGEEAADDAGVSCFVGDEGGQPEIEIVIMQAGGGYVPAADLIEAPILTPPQGGKMIFPGVRARNLDLCGLKLTSSLRDACSNALLSVETRPVSLREGGDGWGEPKDPMQISNYGNLPTCPRFQATRDMEGEPYILTIEVEDRAGRKASASTTVKPVCGAEPELEETCMCECDAEYVLGQTCEPEPDAGPVGGDAGCS